MIDYDFYFGEDKMGMTVTSGSITLPKDDNNLIGISIGGGAPLCPCLYIVQIFDNTAASMNGSLASGDEITAVNKRNVKGMSKVEVAKLIQSVPGEVTIYYNKLHADPKQGKTLDIVLKKVKHRMVEKMSSSTADALGLSRAILCNDSLVKKMDELERNEKVYRGLIIRTRKLLKAIFLWSRSFKALGDVFCSIGVREPQKNASEAFSTFGKIHKEIDAFGIQMLKKSKRVMCDLGTFLTKAIPDTKLTIKKYADAKFEYLSYCLKVKEMDDEEYTFAALNEPLYRVETGNYEYRLVLRCRQEARTRFSKLRSDVLEKLELLDQKHVQDLVTQLHKLLTAMQEYHQNCHRLMKGLSIFPIEIDLTHSTLLNSSPNSNGEYHQGDEQDNEEGGEENEPIDENTWGRLQEAQQNLAHNDDNLLDTSLMFDLSICKDDQSLISLTSSGGGEKKIDATKDETLISLE